MEDTAKNERIDARIAEAMKSPVWVKWVDSASLAAPGWVDIDDTTELKPMEMHTCGFLVNSTQSAITVACSLGENEVLGAITIPRVAILDMGGAEMIDPEDVTG